MGDVCVCHETVSETSSLFRTVYPKFKFKTSSREVTDGFSTSSKSLSHGFGVRGLAETLRKDLLF